MSCFHGFGIGLKFEQIFGSDHYHENIDEPLSTFRQLLIFSWSRNVLLFVFFPRMGALYKSPSFESFHFDRYRILDI